MRTPVNKSKTVKKIESITLTQTRDSIDSSDSLERDVKAKNLHCDDDTAKIDYKKISNFKSSDIIVERKEDEMIWFAAFQELVDDNLVQAIINSTRETITKTMTIKDYSLALGRSTKSSLYSWGVASQRLSNLHCKLYLVTMQELNLLFQHSLCSYSSGNIIKQYVEGLCKDDCFSFSNDRSDFEIRCLGFYHNSKIICFHRGLIKADSQKASLTEECKQIWKMIKIVSHSQLFSGEHEAIVNYVLSSKGIKNDKCKIKSRLAETLKEEMRDSAKMLLILEVEPFKDNIAKAMTQQTCYSSKVSKDMEVNVYNYNLDSGSNKEFILKHLKYGNNISNVNNNINITLINDTKIDEPSGTSKNKIDVKASLKPANLKSRDLHKGSKSNIHIVMRKTVVDDESQEVSSICSIRDSLDFYQSTKSPEKNMFSSGNLEKARVTPKKTKRNFRYYV